MLFNFQIITFCGESLTPLGAYDLGSNVLFCVLIEKKIEFPRRNRDGCLWRRHTRKTHRGPDALFMYDKYFICAFVTNFSIK